MSQPRTSTRVPSGRVPRKIHSDTPRLPTTKWPSPFEVDVWKVGEHVLEA